MPIIFPTSYRSHVHALLAVGVAMILTACGGGGASSGGQATFSEMSPPTALTPAAPGVPPPPFTPQAAANTVVIADLSGIGQINRPVSLGRPFHQGDIAQFVQATIDGTPVLTQTDVKNRWPDGSLKFAIVSFVVPSIPASGSVTITFSNQATGNNSGYLTRSEMLASAFNFDGAIDITAAGTQTVRARDMLEAGHFRYWLQGPVVTAVLLEDRSAARTYDKDTGDGSKALHPIFEAWFYPQGNRVELGYAVENIWASTASGSSMRDQTYSMALRSGQSSPSMEFTHSSFTHIGRTRWHRKFWLGADPGPVRIDHNIKYLVTTKAIPNYDTGIKVAESLVADTYRAWTSADKTIDGSATAVGNYNKSLGAGGAAAWIGLMNTWDTLYLLTMDSRMHEVSLGNADLAGRIPWYFREADSSAGSGDYFDAPNSGSVATFGRPISVNSRKTVTLSDLQMNPANCGSAYASDKINTGTISSDGWDFYALGRHHMPDVAYVPYLLSGRYYYLEQLQLQAAYIVGWKSGCYSQSYERQGEAGYISDSEVRGDAWSYRTLTYAAFLSPDGSPEKAYFDDKLGNNIAKDEGKRGVTLSIPGKLAHWTWGRDNQMYPTGPSPLGLWDHGSSGLVSSPVVSDGTVSRATSPWMEHFVVAALGMSRDMGYPTDNLLKFLAKHLYGQVLNPATTPYLIEGYRFASTLTATDDWIRDWADVDGYHSLPSGWQLGQNVDHGYGYIALGASSFLYPYTVDGHTGVDAWTFLKNNKPEQERFATESPKWAILPR